jgi:FAD/FMN-containing dehydrogenase
MRNRGPLATISRRSFLGGSVALASAGCVPRMEIGDPYASAIPAGDAGTLVNDLHSQLNPTRVRRIVKPAGVDALADAIAGARTDGRPVAIAGGRHAMGGQQFAGDAVLLDTRALDRVLAFDRDAGTLTAEAGIQWPAVIAYLAGAQAEATRPSDARTWGIVQKQTGADRLSLGGALACNAHGRGLSLKPIVDQVRWFDLVDATGTLRRCSREVNPELFRLAIGGYGLFGVVARVQLQLRPRAKVRRVVELAETASIVERFEDRIRAGYLYGDFQFTTDASRDSFLRRGIFSTYQPVSDDTPLTVTPTRFHPADWARLTLYAHRYKRRAFEVYSRRYLQTSGQIYWADSQLSAAYVDGYHAHVDRALGARVKATEMITEIYVERGSLAAFMEAARGVLRRDRADVIYGTVRMIERDDETFLAWAQGRDACVIFNLHIEHVPERVAAAADTFRALIDLGLAHGGRYYLTYHRWATRAQVERAYPMMAAFLSRKRAYDPDDVFQSSWYQHHVSLLSGRTG